MYSQIKDKEDNVRMNSNWGTPYTPEGDSISIEEGDSISIEER
jgi:hypothetical protein